MSEKERLTYKPAEVAELLHVSLPVVYNLCKRSDFPAVRFGRAIVIPADALRAWLAKESGCVA